MPLQFYQHLAGACHAAIRNLNSFKLELCRSLCVLDFGASRRRTLTLVSEARRAENSDNFHKLHNLYAMLYLFSAMICKRPDFKTIHIP